MSAPAKAAASIAKISAGQGALTKAGSAGAKMAGTATAAMQRQTAAAVSGAAGARAFGTAVAATTATTERLSAVTTAATAGLTANARAATTAASSGAQLARVTATASGAAEAGARRFGLLERAQMRGRLAAKALGTQLADLDSRLGKLAMGSIAADGIDRAGRSVLGSLERSVRTAAEYQRGMTGIGILGNLAAPQLQAVSANIQGQAQKLAIPIMTMQQDDMAVLNEGVYRRQADLIRASTSAARLSLLSEAAGTPITGAEAGGLMAMYAHTMLAPASALDRLSATMFKASQIGGMRIGNVARFMPSMMGQMKARAFGNEKGYAAALALLQITKRVTGNDEQAGTDSVDLLQSLSHTFTAKRFAKMGINISDRMARDNSRHIDPITSSLTAIMEKIGSSSTDPKLADKMGKLFVNVQAGTAAMAWLTNQRDTDAGPGYSTFIKKITDPSGLNDYFAGIHKASNDEMAGLIRLQNARDQIAISTGTILAPAVSKMAQMITPFADLVTRMQKQHGFAAKAAVYGVSGVGLLATGAGALGHAIMGVVAPIWIARTMFKALPDAITASLGRVSGSIASFGARTAATEGAVGALAMAAEGVSLGALFGIAAGLVAIGSAVVGVEVLGASRAKIKPADQARPKSIAYGHSLSTTVPNHMRAASDLGVWSQRAALAEARRRASAPASPVPKIATVVRLAAPATPRLAVHHFGAAVAAASMAAATSAAAAHRPPVHVEVYAPSAAPAGVGLPAAAGTQLREVHHHHRTTINVRVTSSNASPRDIAQAVTREHRRNLSSALHDGGDDQ